MSIHRLFLWYTKDSQLKLFYDTKETSYKGLKDFNDYKDTNTILHECKTKLTIYN